ncbi:MAG TPA: alkaline phosphatase family protein [Candidatus Saccharimonadales bacterium]|nr:alkaline phosphatase family protein [Candidatus Saccharimonadales bacterium]
MTLGSKLGQRICATGALCVALMSVAATGWAQGAAAGDGRAKAAAKPKLVVMIVVDQFRADYVEKFREQWSGGLKRLLDEGAWFRSAAYPYAATETCVGHSTVSTGALPLSHGMVANSWWDRDTQAVVTCTSDPNTKNVAYGGGTTSGGDSAWRMLVPSFAEELKFQSGAGTRAVAFSIKARAALTMAGHKADAAVWLDTKTGAWVTSAPYAVQPFIDEFVKAHPIAQDYGKTWALSLPADKYLYPNPAVGAETVEGWGATFPHALRGKEGGSKPDASFYYQWNTSPFADTYLTKMAESAVDALALGKANGAMDYLGVSYSSVDYVGHTFGPKSWEIQDMLVRLDQDLAELFKQLDQRVGRGNYIVAVTGDHGVGPTGADAEQAGFPSGVIPIPVVKERVEKALEPFHLASPAVARMSENDLYFALGVYEQVEKNPAALQAVVDAVTSVAGVAAVYTSDELKERATSVSNPRNAAVLSYFPGRSGDLFVLQQPYWRFESANNAEAKKGAGHGTPYYYDQRVPILMMGFGVKHGEYFEPATPADIAPTLAALTGITLATKDGRVLREALTK